MYDFEFLEDLNCFKITINDKLILIDKEDIDIIYKYKHAKNKKWFFDEKELLYTLDTNNKRRYIVQIIKNIKLNKITWRFINDNKYDYRRNNLEIKLKESIELESKKDSLNTKLKELIKLESNKDNLNVKIKNGFELNISIDLETKKYNFPKDIIIKQSFYGHVPKMGKSAGKQLNKYWLVSNKQLQEEDFYMMYCEPNVYCYFSKQNLNKILFDDDMKYNTWFLLQNGYVGVHYGNTIYYMHQIILDYYSHGNKKESIDHINKNNLDNRLQNLKINVQPQQITNTDKRARNFNAKSLPDGLQQSDLPKYVVYYKEKRGKNSASYREFFRIEKHPSQNGKRWQTSKSNAVSIFDKLEQAKEKINELNNK